MNVVVTEFVSGSVGSTHALIATIYFFQTQIKSLLCQVLARIFSELYNYLVVCHVKIFL